jgi:hypothetical protein
LKGIRRYASIKTMIALWIFVPLLVCLIIIYLGGCCCADRHTKPYTFSCPKKHEAFQRWHDHQIEQFGAAGNTLFAVASAAFGYSLTLLSDSNQSLVRSHTICFELFTSAFAVSSILGIISILNRLFDFRLTARRHKLRDKRDAEKNDRKIKEEHDREASALYKTTRRMGYWTWFLLYAQGLFFLLGGGLISYFWMANYAGSL